MLISDVTQPQTSSILIPGLRSYLRRWSIEYLTQAKFAKPSRKRSLESNFGNKTLVSEHRCERRKTILTPSFD